MSTENEPGARASRVRVRVLPTPADVANAGLEYVLDKAESAISEGRDFRIALAGGTTPKLLYERLSSVPDVAWSRWQIYFGDERAVGPDQPSSNYRMANEALLSRVPLPPANVHRIRGELEPEQAAERYERELGDRPLDLVLLGMGDDGHTASLFPGRPELVERTRRVLPAIAPVQPERRVTLSFRALDEARAVLFLVTGANKASRVARVLSEVRSETPTLPAARVRPQSGALEWYLDEPAAGAI
jgi:6-phosphogluconolactonase